MTAWLKKSILKKKEPDNQWIKCPDCAEILYKNLLIDNINVCTRCGHHFRLSPDGWLGYLVNKGSFKEINGHIESVDPLDFSDAKERYVDKLNRSMKKTGTKSAIVTGVCKIGKQKSCIGIMNFAFMGGSMGSVLGEKVTRLFEHATELSLPVIIISASGGARMHEGVFALFQMAKTSAAIRKHSEAGHLYISIMTDPTTGGVSASFSALGDIMIGEPGALIGFAGPRVIEQTIKQKLPPKFQTAEFLYDHGMLDMIVNRKELKSILIELLTFFG